MLLVEDDGPFRELLAADLIAEGSHILQAHDVPSALVILREHDGQIEWLVTDIRLGELSGLHVAFEFRFLHPTRPIVFITGFEAPRELDRVEQAVVLRKPFTRRLVDTMIELRAAGARSADAG